MKHSPTFLPTASVPWLRRIIAFLSPRSATRRSRSLEVDGDAFIIVEGELAADQHRGLRQWQKTFRMRGRPPDPAGVCKCITACASSRAMWIAEWMVKPAGLVMNGVGSTGLPWTSTLTSARSGHFLEHQIVGVEQEMMLGAGNARRQVGEDEVVPAVIGDHPVGRGEIDADCPFLVADLAFERGDIDRDRRAARPSRG